VGRGLLQSLALFARRRYRLVFVATILIVAAAAGLASRLRFDTDILSLLPQKDPVIQAYLGTLEEFGTFDYLMVLIEIPEGRPVDPYESYADALAARLTAVPELDEVEYRLSGLEEILESFFPQLVFLLDETGRERLTERLSDAGVRRQVAEVRRLLGTPQALVMKDVVRLDPLGLAQIFLDRIESSQGSLAVDWASGYYLSRDQRLLLILAKPKRPPQDIGFDRAMMAKVEAAIAEVDARWEEIAGTDAPPGPRVRVGGSHVAAMIDATLIQQDMTVNSLTSTVLVLLLFYFAFRRLGVVVYAFLPMLAGLALTFGFSALAFGAVSSATSGTAALLIGLGTDFVVVSYGRYVEERRAGKGLDEALAVTMGSTGRAVATGAITTTASFYAFAFTDFRGLAQMGILTGTGILFCVAAVLLLLPALLAWSEDRHHGRASQPRLHVHGFGVDRLMRWCFRHPVPVLALGAVLTVAGGVLALSLEFQDSWRNLRPAGNVGVEVEKEVSEHFGSEFDFMMLVLKGEDLGELMERTAVATGRARELVRSGVLTGTTSVTSIVPPPSRQQEALAWLEAEKRDGSLDPERIRATLTSALAAEGLRFDSFRRGVELLEQALSPREVKGLEGLPVEGQLRRLLDRVLHKKDGSWQSIVYLYPPPEVWRRSAPPEARALAAELGPEAVLTGVNVINEVVRHRVRRDAWMAAVLGTVLVFLLLWADFRRLPPALFSLLPLAVGLVWMFGAMVLLDLPMNFMNIFVTTMIIGIGVDYGVHIVHRYREARSTPGSDLEAGLVETGSAVVISALSTMVGFGSLATSHYPALRSTGYVAALGAVATALVAVTLLPAYLRLRVDRQAARDARDAQRSP
jgi:predicted RND superfamily exporter protein